MTLKTRLMNKKNPNQTKLDLLLKVFLVVIVLVAGAKFALYPSTKGKNGFGDSGKSNFAICLMKKGAIMYGSDTCQYCQIQKKMFGADFEKINYINCDFDQKTCREKEIINYPVWEINGRQIVGIQTFDQLEKTTGCVAPK